MIYVSMFCFKFLFQFNHFKYEFDQSLFALPNGNCLAISITFMAENDIENSKRQGTRYTVYLDIHRVFLECLKKVVLMER